MVNRMRMAPKFSLLLATLSITFSSVAHAAGGDAAAAEQLYRDALKEMAKGEYDKACPRLAESQRLDPGYGTLMHLGDCYVKQGKTASAWAAYQEAADAAGQKKQKSRAVEARKKASDIEPKLSKLTIEVSADVAISGLVVHRDGQEVGEVSWKTPIPVDPGKHDIEVTAPGKIPWKISIEVAGNGETAKVVVSKLADVTSDKPVEKVKKPIKLHSVAIGGIFVGAVGLAAMGASIGVGSAARTRFDQSAGFCNGNLCQAEGLLIRDEAVTLANVGTGVFIGGAACLAAGLVMFIVAPSGKPKDENDKKTVQIQMGPSKISIGGTF